MVEAASAQLFGDAGLVPVVGVKGMVPLKLNQQQSIRTGGDEPTDDE